MNENAELWARTDEESIRRTLKNYLERHFVEIYDEDEITIEELRELYIAIECGKGYDL